MGYAPPLPRMSCSGAGSIASMMMGSVNFDLESLDGLEENPKEGEGGFLITIHLGEEGTPHKMAAQQGSGGSVRLVQLGSRFGSIGTIPGREGTPASTAAQSGRARTASGPTRACCWRSQPCRRRCRAWQTSCFRSLLKWPIVRRRTNREEEGRSEAAVAVGRRLQGREHAGGGRSGRW